MKDGTEKIKQIHLFRISAMYDCIKVGYDQPQPVFGLYGARRGSSFNTSCLLVMCATSCVNTAHVKGKANRVWL